MNDNLNANEEIPEYGDLMTMEEFEECCKDGGFIDTDGFGNYAFKDRMNGEKYIKPSDVIKNKHDKRYTHVVWYNK